MEPTGWRKFSRWASRFKHSRIPIITNQNYMLMKKVYERPEAEVLPVSLEKVLLQLSFEGENSNPIDE